MINRQNWTDVRHYLAYIERYRQNSPDTIDRARGHLRHLLTWADDQLLTKARAIDPTYPEYLVKSNLAPASIVKNLSNVRQFFEHARLEWPIRYKAISESWISMLIPPRQMRVDSRLPVRQYYSLEAVRKIVTVSTETLREQRGQAAVAMLYLSGMRADALASIPASLVDIPNRTVQQLPEHGVRTKNRKAAITYLLNIPDLLAVVQAWDDRVRQLPDDSLWYATLTRDGMQLTYTNTAYKGRNDVIDRDVRTICARAGVEYLSPHKLRHGHVMYALKAAKSLAELKAVSQNVMHASITITDGVYGKLLNDETRQIISNLGAHSAPDLQSQIAELLTLLKQNDPR